MVLDKYTQMSYFEIWQPRYHDKTVLLAARKVGTHNKILFTKAPSMGNTPYYIAGNIVKKCTQESNGKIMCYVVSIEKLEPLEITERSHHEI